MPLTFSDDAAVQLRDAVEHTRRLEDDEYSAIAHLDFNDEEAIAKALVVYRGKVEELTLSLLYTLANMARLGGNVTAGPADIRSDSVDFSFTQVTDSNLFVRHIFFPDKDDDGNRLQTGTWSSHS